MAYTKKEKATPAVEIVSDDITVTASEEGLTVTGEVQTKPAQVVKKKIDRDTIVECRSVTSSTLTYVNRGTGFQTDWADYGDLQYLTVGELLAMRSSQGKFLSYPWIMIDDEEVAEYLGLKSLYDRIIPVDEIDDFFRNDPETIRTVLKTAPLGTKSLVRDRARQMIADQTLYDTRIIKILAEELEFQVELFQ